MIVIAEFRGHSRTIPGTWLPVADNRQEVRSSTSRETQPWL